MESQELHGGQFHPLPIGRLGKQMERAKESVVGSEECYLPLLR
jgi:hypothetical protein